MPRSPFHLGVGTALGAAALFGAGTPVAKLLLADTSPWLLAGLLYLGSGVGLTIYRALRRRRERTALAAGDGRWLAGAVLFGGVVAPVLMMTGLAGMAASGASLLLNAEAVFTALIAWLFFRENAGRRVVAGMVAIVAGAVVLGRPDEASLGDALPMLAVLGACLCWGIDNNLTRKVSLADAAWVASVKGLVAGVTNLTLALALGATWPRWPVVAAAMTVGFFAYGVSLAGFVVALRHLGTARTAAYFGVAPFFGALVAVPLLGEPVTPALLAAAALMAVGVGLHLTERHAHAHRHEQMAHAHAHGHDAHHRHAHAADAPPGEPHDHWHRHEPTEHDHPHVPDAHHRHSH